MAVVSLTPFNQHFQFGLPISSQVYTKLLLRGRVKSGRVSQIGSVFRGDRPRFKWCCFGSSSLGGPPATSPRPAHRTGCTGARRLKTIEPENTKFRSWDSPKAFGVSRAGDDQQRA